MSSKYQDRIDPKRMTHRKRDGLMSDFAHRKSTAIDDSLDKEFGKQPRRKFDPKNL